MFGSFHVSNDVQFKGVRLGGIMSGLREQSSPARSRCPGYFYSSKNLGRMKAIAVMRRMQTPYGAMSAALIAPFILI
jgi:hypothetical protein